MSDLGYYLKGQRLLRNLSLREAARIAGVSGPYLSQIERGKRQRPHPDKLKKLASAYDIDLNTLMKVAGYLDTGEEERDAIQVEKEFASAISDQRFSYGHRLREDLDLETKRFIVTMYRQLRSASAEK